MNLGVALTAWLSAVGLDAATAGQPIPSADAPTVTVRADKSEARVGDPIAVTVSAIGPVGTPINLPSSGTLDLAPFSLLDRKDEEKDLGDGKMRREFVLSVAAYEPGDVTLPPLDVTYLGKGGDVLTAHTAPVPIKIVSLLANESEPALKDNAEPVPVLERNLLVVYIAAGLVVAALGGIVGLIIRKRWKARASQRPAPPRRPPHEVALERLDRLGASGFPEGGDLRPFTFALSEIIREYLGARFGFDSLELTTEELVSELRRSAGGSLSLVMGEVSSWLRACDLVKFAKVSPTITEARGALETAIRIVEGTRPQIAPPAALGATALRESTGG